jgi:hypothetical protein
VLDWVAKPRSDVVAQIATANAQKALAALTLVVSLAVAACGAPASGQATYPAIHVKMDVDRYEYTTLQSMCSAILISEVIVGSHGEPHWNTSNGQRPLISDSNSVVTQGYRIYTPLRFTQNHPLIDHRPAPTKQFVTDGGQVGSDSIAIEPFPVLRDGGHYLVVFSPGLTPAGKGTTTDWLVVYDAFPIDAHGMVQLQAASPTNEPGLGQPQPEIKLSLTSLKQQLAAC